MKKKLISFSELEKQAHEIRQLIFQMVTKAQTSHIASAYSIVDILVTLYNNILSLDPKKPHDADRDRFILSKGWAIAGLYATLAVRGFFDKTKLEEYCADGSEMVGCATRNTIPGVEATTGSMGHGLPIGVGMALAGKLQKKSYRVFVIVSDGECDEGATWEAILQAGQWQLDNLVVIVDYNKWQSFGRVKDVLDLEPFTDKWNAFRWSVREMPGHDREKIQKTLLSVPFEKGKPSVIIAHTTKGKGISVIEDNNDFHYKTPRQEIFDIGKKELGL